MSKYKSVAVREIVDKLFPPLPLFACGHVSLGHGWWFDRNSGSDNIFPTETREHQRQQVLYRFLLL